MSSLFLTPVCEIMAEHNLQSPACNNCQSALVRSWPLKPSGCTDGSFSAHRSAAGTDKASSELAAVLWVSSGAGDGKIYPLEGGRERTSLLHVTSAWLL